MKAFTEKELIEFFQKTLSEQYDLYLPIKMHDGTRSLGKLEDSEFALSGGALPMKPTAMFMPYIDLVLRFKKDGSSTPAPAPTKPLAIIGFTTEDLECLSFIDKFFSSNYQDEIYLNKRKAAFLVGISGLAGANDELLKIADGKCDCELIKIDTDRYLLMAYSEIGKKLTAKIPGGTEVDEKILQDLQKESTKVNAADQKILEKAMQLILENKVPDVFWQSIADRCIACTACTLVCPTCTCFEVFDRKSSLPAEESSLERWRMRDSCLLDGFMREASGHNPMAKEWQRTRRRICHKLCADVKRWGHSTCFLCGRCDQACPSSIGIKSACREMVEKYS